MNVAVLSRVAHPLHGFGGLERHVGSLVRHLSRCGAKVTLYTSPPKVSANRLDGSQVVAVPYRVIPWPERSGFVIADRNTNYIAWSLRAGRKALASGADIVEAEAGSGFGYAALRSSVDAPFVFQAHGMEEFKAGRLKRSAYLPLRLATRFAARRAAMVLAPDRAMEKEVQRYLSVSPDRTTVLPMAVDLEEIDRDVPPSVRENVVSQLGIEPRTAVILSVGRLEANKGFSSLLRALCLARDRLPQPWLWVLVGRGPLAPVLLAEVENLGLAKQARLAGRLSDEELGALYDRADLFIHPTLYEGSSLVTLEAMAHRRPVVATSVGGIPDKVVDGENGFLVPPGEAEALAAALLHAFSLGDSLGEMGARGRRRVETDFSWSVRARRLLEIYRRVLELG